MRGEERDICYRLTGSSVMRYEFFTRDDEPVAIGDFFVINDQQKGCRFYARVNEIIHQVPESLADLSDEPRVDTLHGLIQVVGSPIGYADTMHTFRKPRIIPTRLSPVHYPDAEDITFLRSFMGEIEIGYLVSGQQPVTDLPIRIPAKVLTQHMGIFGTTGMGKSNLMKVFAASAMSKRAFGMLLVDPHGEYLTGSGSPGSKGLLQNTDHLDGLAVYSNREDQDLIKHGIKRLQLDYDDLTITDLNILFRLSPEEKELINLLLPYHGRDILGFFIEEHVESLPSSTKTTAYIGNYQEIATRVRGATSGARQAVQRQIGTLLDLSSSFLNERGSVLHDIVQDLLQNKVVLIDIPQVSEIAELLILSVLSRAILEAYKNPSKYLSDTIRHQVLISIEEAQRVLSGSEETGIFREIAMEGRKFGVGLCVITQQPKNIDPQVLAQLNSLLILGLADQQDRETIASSAKHDLRIMDLEIQTLDRGDAVISTIGIPFPVSCRVHEYEEYLLTQTRSRS